MAETFTPTLLTQINNQASSAVSVINANFQAIATALNDVLSRTAVAPNQMGAVLDMNNNRIINLPAAAYPTDPLRLEDLQSSTAFANVLAQATTASTAAASAAAAALSSAAQAAASAAAAATSVVVGQAGVLTGTTLAANVVNSSLTKVGTLTSGAIGSGFTAIPTTALAASTISGVTLGGTLATLTLGTHLTAGGTSYNGSTAVTVTSDATNLNTASTIVARDGSGNFSANTITAALTGTASGNLPLIGGTLTGELKTIASTATTAGLNVPPGTAPTSPANGDIWTTSGGAYVQINGATVGPLGTGGSTFTGGTLTSELITTASTTTNAGLNIPPGTAPTTPSNGDVWTTSSGIYVRINGTTVGPLGTGGGGGLIPWSITGGFPTSASTSSLTISACTCVDATTTTTLTYAGGTVTTGTGINTLGVSSLAASTTYHVYLCNGTSGTGIYGSTTLSMPPSSAPSGYQAYVRRLFSFITNASSAIIAWNAVEVESGAVRFFYTTPPNDINSSSGISSPTLEALSVPSGFSVETHFTGTLAYTSALNVFFYSPLNSSATTAVTGNLYLTASGATGADFFLYTNTSRQIYIYGSTGLPTVKAYTHGYKDQRRI